MRPIVLIVAVILGAVGCAEFDPNGELPPILFESDRSGMSDIFEISEPGVTRNLTNTPGIAEVNPSPSPDGEHFAYMETGSLWVRTRSGSLQFLIGGGLSDPAWSPDGKWIAYSNGSQIQAIRPDGSSFFQITTSTFDTEPSWSPDSQRVAFTFFDGTLGWKGVYTADVFGTRAEQPLVVGPWDAVNPAWAPGGDLVAFSSRRPPSLDYEIYVIGSDGRGERRLTFDPMWDDVQPAWSPDGTRIVWTKGPSGVGQSLWIMDASGNEQKLVVDSPGFRDQNPAW